MKLEKTHSPLAEHLLDGLPRSVRNVLFQIAAALVGVFMAQTNVLGQFSPFAIALAAALDFPSSLAAAAGGGIGYLISASATMPLRYIATLAAVVLVGLGLGALPKMHTGLAKSLNAFLCCTATGMALGISQGFSVNTALLYLAEGVLCGACTYFLQKALTCGSRNSGLRSLSVPDTACVIISIGLVLVGMSSVTIGSIAPARILAVFLILLAGRYGGTAAGSIVGVAAGMAMGLAPDMSHLMGAYALGGLLAGLCSPVGQLGSAAAFAVSNAIVAVLENGSPEAVASMIEVGIASTLFVIMPSAWGNKIDQYFHMDTDLPLTDTLRQSVIMRLRFASNALGEVSQSVEAVSYKLKEMDVPDLQAVYRKAYDGACEKCVMRFFCWDQNYNTTMNALNDMRLVLKETELLTPKNIPKHFASRCVRLPLFLENFNQAYRDFLVTESANERVGQVRQIVADQFYGVSDMLQDLAQEFDEAETFDVETASKVKNVLQAFGILPHDVSCVLDKYGRMTVEIHCPPLEKKVDCAALNQAMRQVCDRIFERPAITTAGGETLIAYFERAALRARVGACQYACNQGVLCGDAFESLLDGRGRQILVLSDGMGSGGRAAVDGAMAAGLLAKLVKAGFGFDCSLRVVNSALLVKSNEESLATLDIASIDLFTGTTDFYKAGATASFVRRGKKAGRVELASLPAGILREVEFAHSKITLRPGDLLVLVSDGVVEGSGEWICAFLEDWKGGDPKALAEEIVEQAQRRRQSIHEDDMTVLAVQIEKGV